MLFTTKTKQILEMTQLCGFNGSTGVIGYADSGYVYSYQHQATFNWKLVSATKMLAQRTRAGGISLSLCYYSMTSS